MSELTCSICGKQELGLGWPTPRICGECARDKGVNAKLKQDDAKALCEKWMAHRIVILAVNETQGTFEVHSYGVTKAQCAVAKLANMKIADMMEHGEMI